MQNHSSFCNSTNYFYMSVNGSTKFSKSSCKNTKRVFITAASSWKTIIKKFLLNITVNMRVRLQHLFLYLKGIVSHKNIWIIFSIRWHIIWWSSTLSKFSSLTELKLLFSYTPPSLCPPAWPTSTRVNLYLALHTTSSPILCIFSWLK